MPVVVRPQGRQRVGVGEKAGVEGLRPLASSRRQGRWRKKPASPGRSSAKAATAATGPAQLMISAEARNGPGGRAGAANVSLARWSRASARPAAWAWPTELKGVHDHRLAVQVVPVEQVQYLVDELVLCPRRTGTVIEGHRDGHPVCRQVPHKSVLGLQAAGGPHGPMVTLDDEPALLAGTGAGHRNDGRGGERPWAVPGDTGGGSALLQAGHAPQELAHLLGPQWRPVGRDGDQPHAMA